MRRAMRLAALGAGIGSAATALFAALAYLLRVAVDALWQVSIPDVGTESALSPGLEVVDRAARLIAAAAGAGAAAGVGVASLRVSARADWRALIVSLVAALGWLFMSAWAMGDAPWPPQRAAALVIVGLGVGALAWAALWTPLATALQQAVGLARTVWAGARRLAGFALALLGALGAGLIGVFALGILVRAALGQLPQDAWAAGFGAVSVFALALGTSVLGLYAAGVPRRWSRRLDGPNHDRPGDRPMQPTAKSGG